MLTSSSLLVFFFFANNESCSCLIRLVDMSTVLQMSHAAFKQLNSKILLAIHHIQIEYSIFVDNFGVNRKIIDYHQLFFVIE